MDEVSLSRDHNVDEDAAERSDLDAGHHHHHHKRPTRRRRRSFYTRCQLAVLETAFSCEGHYPDQRQRERLARTLNVTESRVRVCIC